LDIQRHEQGTGDGGWGQSHIKSAILLFQMTRAISFFTDVISSFGISFHFISQSTDNAMSCAIDFSYCIKPLLVFLRAFGMFPISNTFFTRKTKKWMRIASELIFYGLLIAAGVLIVLNLYLTPLKNIWNFSLAVGFLTFFVTIVYQRMKWKSILKFIKLIKNIDEKVKI
jgi:pheromone shutdown protein TraB